MPCYKNDFQGHIDSKKVFMTIWWKLTLSHNSPFPVPGRLFVGTICLRTNIDPEILQCTRLIYALEYQRYMSVY